MQHALAFAPPDAPALPKVDYAFPSQTWNGLILVGEAPGKEEVRLGQPFVGRSGKLLNELLAEAQIDRAACLVANVFRFQPPANKVDHFFISRKKAAAEGCGIAEKWGKFGSLWCRDVFAGEIEHLRLTFEKLNKKGQRPTVLALGRTPFWALTGENSLLAHVGKLFDCRLLPGASVIPTFHPSFILRGNWGLRPEWKKHFVAAKQNCN